MVTPGMCVEMRYRCRKGSDGRPMIMQLVSRTGGEPSNEELELYSMVRLSEQASARLEEHILLCESCRARLNEFDEFVNTIRRALREPNVVMGTF